MTSLVLGVPTVPVTYSSNYCTDYLHMLMFFDSVKCFGDKTCAGSDDTIWHTADNAAVRWSYESQGSTAANCTLQQQKMLTTHCWFWLYTIK